MCGRPGAGPLHQWPAKEARRIAQVLGVRGCHGRRRLRLALCVCAHHATRHRPCGISGHRRAAVAAADRRCGSRARRRHRTQRQCRTPPGAGGSKPRRRDGRSRRLVGRTQRRPRNRAAGTGRIGAARRACRRLRVVRVRPGALRRPGGAEQAQVQPVQAGLLLRPHLPEAALGPRRAQGGVRGAAVLHHLPGRRGRAGANPAWVRVPRRRGPRPRRMPGGSGRAQGRWVPRAGTSARRAASTTRARWS